MGFRTKAELVPVYNGREPHPGDTLGRVWNEQGSLAAQEQVPGSTIPFYMIGQDPCGAEDHSSITKMGCGVCWKGVNTGSSRGERTAREGLLVSSERQIRSSIR